MITLIKILCNERYRKYFNSFRSTMKQHRQKQIAKNFPLQQNGKFQMLLNACIGIGKKLSVAHHKLTCSRRSGQWREMGNGGKQTWKRVRGRDQEDLSPSLPNPAPWPFFLARISLLFPNSLKVVFFLLFCLCQFLSYFQTYFSLLFPVALTFAKKKKKTRKETTTTIKIGKQNRV